jgi:hypothetical protein
MEHAHENQRTRELRTSSYELFIGGLSILSILNLVLLLLPITDQVKQLILIVDVALTLIFLIDFTLRFLSRRPLSRGTSSGAVAGWISLAACRRYGSFGCFVCSESGDYFAPTDCATSFEIWWATQPRAACCSRSSSPS